jgi:CheY-like chemotaxis protein
LQLAIEIRADPLLAATPLVVIASSAAVDDPATVSAVGFEAFLTSPVREAQLHRCLSRLAALSVPNLADNPARTAATESQLRLLLAEDNPASQLVAQMLLTKMGHKVDVVGNGELALERLATDRYDAVLMDCQMPVLDGYETARRIRAGGAALNARVPIIALTAYAMPDDRRKCLAAGMDDYVTKPVRAHELRAALLRCGVLKDNLAAEASARSALTAGATAEAILDPAVLENVRQLPGRAGPSLLPELVADFARDMPRQLQQLGELAAQKNRAELASRAHSMAASCASLGASAMRGVALSVEQAARAEGWDELPARLEALRRSWSELRAELEAQRLVPSETAGPQAS